MPYVNEQARENARNHPTTAGELNYAVTSLVWDYIKGEGISYAIFNEVIGVLECAKLELYRRQVAVYEDRKRIENGDVYI